MKFNTYTRYGLRALIDLAFYFGKGFILLKDVAKRQNISERYLENIMVRLSAAGFVVSNRGKNGGFSLARDPKKIKVLDVVKILEGSLAPVPCVDNPDICSLSSRCATRILWKNVKEKLHEVFESLTLNDLMKIQNEFLEGDDS